MKYVNLFKKTKEKKNLPSYYAYFKGSVMVVMVVVVVVVVAGGEMNDDSQPINTREKNIYKK